MRPKAHSNEEWLGELLREDDVYIEDDGFTARVMDQLPPVHRPFRWRRLVLMASALLACIAGLVLVPGGAYLTEILAQAASYRPASAPLPLVPIAVLLLVAGGAAAAAVAHD